MNWEVVIGLETHAQLQTQSKIFSGASTAFGAEPNAQACAVDIALPGVLPVLNREAVVCAIKFGLAVGADDRAALDLRPQELLLPGPAQGLPDQPVRDSGRVGRRPGHSRRRGGKDRAPDPRPLEEDAGKSLHEDFHGKTGIDLNRAGTPLLEIVTEPDMRSSAEAVAYAKALHALVRWIGICDGNMQEGSLPLRRQRLGAPPRRAARHAPRDQEPQFLPLPAAGHRLRDPVADQRDRGRPQDPAGDRAVRSRTRGETRAMRSKEDAHDYRYFPDPDLLPLEITPAWIAEVKAELPELPQAMKAALRGRLRPVRLRCRDADRHRAIRRATSRRRSPSPATPRPRPAPTG